MRKGSSHSRESRAKMGRPLAERFAEKWTPEPNSGCWLWTASLTTAGYGSIGVGAGRTRNAHIVSWNLHRGDVPDGLELDHLCRNRACVNPDHLEPVTGRENVRRGLLGVLAVKPTNCPQGHEYTPENTSFTKRGWMYCDQCKRDKALPRMRARRLALRLARARAS
jgi:hypothetical protein